MGKEKHDRKEIWKVKTEDRKERLGGGENEGWVETKRDGAKEDGMKKRER